MFGHTPRFDPRSFAGCEVGRREFTDFAICETVYHPHQEIPHHVHDLSYISIALQGSYTERCQAASFDVLPGHVILHAPGESHSNHFHKVGGQVLNLELLPSFLGRLAELCSIQLNCRHVLRSKYALQIGARLHKEFSSADLTSSWALEGLTMELMAEIFRDRIPEVKVNGCAWLDIVIEMLNDKYNQSITLNEIASCVSVHPVHLARAFRKRYLCSIGEYTRRLRIEAACRELLSSNAPIVDVAFRTGFSDQSHLCRALKEYSGMSPRQFRRSRVAKVESVIEGHSRESSRRRLRSVSIPASNASPSLSCRPSGPIGTGA